MSRILRMSVGAMCSADACKNCGVWRGEATSMSPLFKKLNLGNCSSILVLDAPSSFEPELAQLDGVAIRRKGTSKPSTEFAMGFAVTQSQLDKLSKILLQSTEGDAVVWIAYPKQTSKEFKCEFNRDSGWTVLREAGLEPVRQVAIDENWSALRFRRTEYIKVLTRRQK